MPAKQVGVPERGVGILGLATCSEVEEGETSRTVIEFLGKAYGFEMSVRTVSCVGQ